MVRPFSARGSVWTRASRFAVAAAIGLAGLSAAAAAEGARALPSAYRPDQAAFPLRACSFRAPLCVHAARGVKDAVVARALAAGEAAFGTLEALGIPGPLADGGRGGSSAFDAYLQAAGDAAFVVDVDALDGGLDRASAFALLDGSEAAGRGCALEGAMARAVAFGAAMRLDAGMEDGASSLLGSYLEDLSGACPREVLESVDDFQRAPDRALVAGRPEVADGALLFPAFLDQTYGLGTPGEVLTGLLAVAAQRTAPDALTFGDEPDLFDALRSNLRARGKTLDKALLDFAVARAFVGSRSDAMHLEDAERFGDAGRVGVEWDVAFSSIPRRLAPARPIEATGTTYFWLDLRGAPADAEVTFVAEWEVGVLFRWALVKVEPDGSERGRFEPAAMNGSTTAQTTMHGLSGLAGLLVVGVNAGSIDRSHPYDPDEATLPHACTVLFAK